MCKKSIITFCMLLIGSMVNAQGVLEIKDISQPNDVYASENDEAAVVVRCHKSIHLTFSSSMDKTVNPYNVEQQGSDVLYYLSFPTGKRYRGREITIVAEGFSPVCYRIELQPKQYITLHVTDPNATVDAGCYREHRNKGMLEFKNSNYEEAKNHFVLARMCSDVDSVENEKNITLADSMIFYRAEAEQAYEQMNYASASHYYTKILAQNSNDKYARERNQECVRFFSQECMALFSKAEYYYKEKEYDKAKALYEKVLEMECMTKTTVSERLNTINSLEHAKKYHSRVITYEFMKDMPLGFSYGKCNMHRSGWFIQMDFNTKAFEAIRGNCRYGDTKFPEANIALGWTIKTCDYVWVHFGPGFTWKGYYGAYKGDSYPTVGYGEDDLLDTKEMGTDLKLPKAEIPKGHESGWEEGNSAFAISPVIGVTAKYSYFAFRLSYQYRWSTKSELKDFMGTSRISVGVGVAF